VPAALGVPCRLGGEATCQYAKLPIALSAAARSLRRPSGASAPPPSPAETLAVFSFELVRRVVYRMDTS
jgi:hypothetical protein